MIAPIPAIANLVGRENGKICGVGDLRREGAPAGYWHDFDYVDVTIILFVFYLFMIIFIKVYVKVYTN